MLYFYLSLVLITCLINHTNLIKINIPIENNSSLMKSTEFKTFLLLIMIILNGLPANLFAQSDTKYVKVSAKKRVKDKTGKMIYGDWVEFDTQSVDILPGFHPVQKQSFTKYGSNPKQKVKVTGFFRTEKIGDRWWVVDPEGYLTLHVAINSVSPGRSDKNKEAFKKKFNTPENWIKETNIKFHALGFNGTGSWSDHDQIKNAPIQKESPLAYCINWNFMSSYGKERGGTFQQPGHTGYPKDAIFVFDPEFETYCDKHAQLLTKYKDDATLFGYFSDNEMPFPEKVLANYLSLPKNDNGYKAAVKWLSDNKIDSNNIDDAARNRFRAFVGEKYFSVVSKAIKKYDPNHIYLGSRLYGSEKSNETFMRAIGKYIDIISCNYYNVWTPNPADLKNWTDWTGKPFIITEWYTKGEDSGMPNQTGAGWIVKTQKDRGLFYQNYTLALLKSKNCVGWHWFKYQDNDPTDKNADPSNSDSNKGILDNNFDYYQDLIDLMKQLNDNRFELINYFDSKKQ